MTDAPEYSVRSETEGKAVLAQVGVNPFKVYIFDLRWTRVQATSLAVARRIQRDYINENGRPE